MRRHIITVGVLLALTGATGAHPQPLQRMAFAAGRLSLGPGASSAVRTFCLDLTRAAPGGAVQMNRVLTDPGSARVIRGGQSYPLQTALDNGWVRIEGMDRRMMLADFMRALNNPRERAERLRQIPEDRRAQLLQMRDQWNALSHDQQALLSRSFGTLAEGPDHTRLRLVNHSNLPLEVVFDRTAVVGAQAESLAGLNLHLVRTPVGEIDQQAIQTAFWAHETAKHQRHLRALGYYSGRVDGKSGALTEQAILDFQRSQGLAETGELDAASDAVLRQMGTARFARDANAQDQQLLFASVTRDDSDPSSRYRLTLGDEREVVTNSEADIFREVISAAQRRGAEEVYFDLQGFSDTRASGFFENASMRFNEAHPDATVHALPRSISGMETHQLYVRRGTAIEWGAQPAVRQVTSGRWSGWWETTITFLTRSGAQISRVTARVYTRTLNAANRIATTAGFRSGVTALRPNDSIATIVQAVRRDFLANNAGRRGDIAVELAPELGSRFFVDASHRRTSGVG